MNDHTKNKNTHILKDPVGEYIKQNPDHTKSALDKINALALSRQKLDFEFNALDEKTKELSKAIGLTKKQGQDASELKLQMQSLSKRKADLLRKTKDLEDEILGHYDIRNKNNVEEKTKSAATSCRTYTGKNSDIEQISIKVLGDKTTEWNDYVAKKQSTSIYHQAEWRELIRTTFGHEGYYIYATDKNNRLKGILPLIIMKSKLFGRFMVSMPYFNYGGAVADHPDIENKLMQAAEKHADTINVSHIEYRDDIVRDQYPVRTDKVNMILTLPSSKQELWESFSPKVRAQIKRPQRENISVQRGQYELLDDFYAVFCRNMRDLGTPVYGKSFFQNILSTYPGNCSILTVSLHKKPVAAAFLIGHRDTLEIPWASSLRSVNHISINMLMYWEVLSFAIESGYNNFDFGRSSIDSGTYNFKKQWGAKPRQLYWHYWLSDGKSMPSLNPSNSKFRLAITIWKRLPLTLARILGPRIVKNLP